MAPGRVGCTGAPPSGPAASLLRARNRWSVVLGVSLGALAACGDDPITEGVPSWSFELESLDPALLALASLDASGGNLLAVGGPLAGTAAPSLYHRAGVDAGWASSPAPAGWQGAIWWAWGASPSDVWVVGDAGQIAKGALGALALQTVSGVTNETTFYGVWGSGPSDVWMVGGTPRAREPRGTLLHWDGNALTRVEPTGTASIALSRNLFKVWGSGPNDVMVVGTRGLAIHWDGTTWKLSDTGTNVQLTTVHGRGSLKYAVGGLNQGVVLEQQGDAWTEIGDPFAPSISGVFAAPDGKLWVAGDSGYLAYREGGEWKSIDTGTFGQFHAVLATPTELFGVGGILSASAEPRKGFLGRYGP